jgi:UDP-glucose 4-epimerase
MADAHVRALEYFLAGGRSCALKLANAPACSVKEVIAAAETVESEFVARRQGERRY